MSPQSIQLADGRIIRVCNFPAVNSSSESALEKLTGKIFLAGSVKIGKDAFTRTDSPDNPQGLSRPDDIYLGHYSQPTIPDPYRALKYYAWIGQLPANKNINYYCYWQYDNSSFTIEVYETVDTWGEETITWNNQPAFGVLLGTFTRGALNDWWTFPTGTTESIAIRITPQLPPGGFSVPYNAVVFRSAQYSVDPTKRPYISDP